MTQSTIIETKPCGRCGGSGSYSWCAMHGSRCFGCGGTGKVHTKRGAAASAFLKRLREVPVETIKVGDLIFQEHMMSSTGKFYAVTEVTRGIAKEMGCYSGDGQYEQIRLVTSYCTEYHTAGAMVRKGWTGPEKVAQYAQALAYQDTLGVSGKPLKRAAKKVAA